MQWIFRVPILHEKFQQGYYSETFNTRNCHIRSDSLFRYHHSHPPMIDQFLQIIDRKLEISLRTCINCYFSVLIPAIDTHITTKQQTPKQYYYTIVVLVHVKSTLFSCVFFSIMISEAFGCFLLQLNNLSSRECRQYITSYLRVIVLLASSKVAWLLVCC
jgi:hypothetical protein